MLFPGQLVSSLKRIGGSKYGSCTSPNRKCQAMCRRFSARSLFPYSPFARHREEKIISSYIHQLKTDRFRHQYSCQKTRYFCNKATSPFTPHMGLVAIRVSGQLPIGQLPTRTTANSDNCQPNNRQQENCQTLANTLVYQFKLRNYKQILLTG